MNDTRDAVRNRSAILLLLLLTLQVFGSQLPWMSDKRPCDTSPAVRSSCCAPGHCDCAAQSQDHPAPPAPAVPAPAENDPLPPPVLLPLSIRISPPAPVRPAAATRIARITPVAPQMPRLTTAFCTFLI